MATARVPRMTGRDADYHAAGLAHAHGERTRHVGWDDFAGDLGRHRGRFAQHVGGQGHVELVPHRRAAGFLDGGFDELAAQGFHLVGGFQEQRAAGARLHGRPGREGSLRGSDGGVDIVERGGGGAGGDFAGGGIMAFEAGAIRGGARLAVDQQIGLEHQRSPLLSD